MPKFSKPDLPPVVEDALWKVLRHNMHDEEKHYRNCDPEDEVNHIYLSLVTIAQWLHGEELVPPPPPDTPEQREEKMKASREKLKKITKDA